MKFHAIIKAGQNSKMLAGGELAVQNDPETLGDVVKAARIQGGFTIEWVAEQVDITARYLYRIENEGQKPSFEILRKLIRVLSIPADSIFYPERAFQNAEMEEIVHMVYNCDQRSLKIARAVLWVLLESQQEN